MFDVVETERYPGLRLHYHASPILTENQAIEVSIAKWEQLVGLCNQTKLVDDGGSIYLLELVGIEYDPIIVTVAKRGQKLKVHCPVCQQVHTLKRNQPGSELICPTPGCDTRLKPNTFVTRLS